MQDDFLLKIEEGSRNITIDLRQDPAAFPEPTLFSWSKDRQTLSATTELTLTYSSVTINTVRRADAGNYTVTATNFVLPDVPVANQLSNDTGSFYLDIICKLHKNVLGVIVIKTMNTVNE
ncbi:MAG: immunoglobulin domain-containing protein [Proteobacteria bacterium]|nr:immunoglobulin domain-containing protein [Pseudomonadota bacterium]